MASFEAITVSQPSLSVENMLGRFSTDQADAMFKILTNATANEISFSPKLVERLGQEACVLVGSEAVIAGKPQHLGLKINFFPSASADGSSLDLGMFVQYTVPTAPEDATGISQ